LQAASESLRRLVANLASEESARRLSHGAQPGNQITHSRRQLKMRWLDVKHTLASRAARGRRANAPGHLPKLTDVAPGGRGSPAIVAGAIAKQVHSDRKMLCTEKALIGEKVACMRSRATVCGIDFVNCTGSD
jgi:hypothetical protein